jgi:hypothetical protein
MTGQRITKRTVDALKPNGSEFTVWDDTVSAFGVRVRPSGAMSYVVVYRAGAGRGAPVRRYTSGAVRKIAPEQARARAKVGHVQHKTPCLLYPQMRTWRAVSALTKNPQVFARGCSGHRSKLS